MYQLLRVGSVHWLADIFKAGHPAHSRVGAGAPTSVYTALPWRASHAPFFRADTPIDFRRMARVAESAIAERSPRAGHRCKQSVADADTLKVRQAHRSVAASTFRNAL